MNGDSVRSLVVLELTRRYRATFGDTRKLAVAIVLGLFALVPLGLLVGGAYAAGIGIAAGELEPSLDVVRAIGAMAVVLVGLVATFRAIQTTAVPANADALLLAADRREVVGAVLLTEIITTGALFGGPGGLAAVAFGLGADSVSAALGALLALALLVPLAIILGMSLGVGVRLAIARSAILARFKTAIGVLLLLGYFAALVAVGPGIEGSAFLGPVLSAVARTPLGWFGDLALIGTAVPMSPTPAIGAIGLAVGGGLLGAAATDRLADELWYEAAVEAAPRTGSAGMGDLPGVSRPVAMVAHKSWLRGWRSPIRLVYVVYPLFVVVGPLSAAIRTGQIPPYLPGYLALYGAWAAGAAFTLNPIGDETAVLPITLTTPLEGREFMAGCCLAGAVLGVPIAALAAVAVAIAAGMPATSVAAVGVLGITMPLGATSLATGIGATVPRLEAVTVVRGRKAVIPSLLGFTVYSLALTIVALPGIVVATPTFRTLLPLGGTAPAVLIAGGIGLTVLLLGAIAGMSYRHAAGVFDRYTLE